MSTEKDSSSRSPSFRERLPAVRVDLAAKRIPQDFFPKTLSQSPSKRHPTPPQRKVVPGDILADWYRQEQSPPKSRPAFCRLPFQQQPLPGRKLAPADKEVRQQPNPNNETHPTAQNAFKVKAGVFQRSRLRQRTSQLPQRPPLVKEEVGPIKGEASGRPRVIRSVSQDRRSMRSPGGGEAGGEGRCRVKVREIRRSLRALPCYRQSEEKGSSLAIGFDGMLTFNRYRE